MESLQLIIFTLLIYDLKYVIGDFFELRDIKFVSDYNKNELPPNHDGKPLLVRIICFKRQCYIFHIIRNKYGHR